MDDARLSTLTLKEFFELTEPEDGSCRLYVIDENGDPQKIIGCWEEEGRCVLRKDYEDNTGSWGILQPAVLGEAVTLDEFRSAYAQYPLLLEDDDMLCCHVHQSGWDANPPQEIVDFYIDEVDGELWMVLVDYYYQNSGWAQGVYTRV